MPTVTFRAEERQLSGRVFRDGRRGSDRAGLLFIHGLGSRQDGYWPRAEVASSELGATSLTFDLSGHGQSPGPLNDLSLRDHLAEVVAAYDRLTGEDDVDPHRIGVCGASYGGYLATLLTAERPVRRLLLRAPALYEDADFAVPRSRRPPSREVPREASRALGALQHFKGAVMVIESGKDKEILPPIIEAYRRACPGADHHVIPGAAHALSEPAWEEDFRTQLLGFFRQL